MCCYENGRKREGRFYCTNEKYFKKTDYQRFILEVTDANEAARHIYKKLGFREYEKIKERFPKLKGFNYRIYMDYFKTKNQ